MPALKLQQNLRQNHHKRQYRESGFVLVLEPRLPDCRIAAKVRFLEMKTLVPVNTFDTEPCPIGSLLQCEFPKADIAERRRVNLL
jgi:hypothetical protein